jgi:hypothetical protein
MTINLALNAPHNQPPEHRHLRAAPLSTTTIRPAAVISREGVQNLVQRIFDRYQQRHPERARPEHLEQLCREIVDGIGRM